MCKANRGTRRARDSKNVGRIRKEPIGGYKDETVLAIRGKKPPSVFFMVIGISKFRKFPSSIMSSQSALQTVVVVMNWSPHFR